MADWKARRILPDKDGCQFYLEKYKPFRLTALQRDPDAFGSTYEKEIHFTDADWLRRVRNPLATTFVAVAVHDETVLSATSLLGPLADDGALSGVPPSLTINGQKAVDHEADQPVVFELGGVYTASEARGRGLARALMELVTREVLARTPSTTFNGSVQLRTTVYATNSDAIAFYERCGFVASSLGPQPSVNPLKDPAKPLAELQMYWTPPPTVPGPDGSS